MTVWITSLRDRPIAERERRGALALMLVLLLVATLFLVATRPAASRNHSRNVVPPHSQAPVSSRPSYTAPSEATVAHTSRGFLAGYLAYVYGRAPASEIKDATPVLVVSLQAHPPRVSPATRERKARIVALHTVPAPAGRVAVQALVNDGGLVDYPLELLLEDRDGRLLVSALGDER